MVVGRSSDPMTRILLTWVLALHLFMPLLADAQDKIKTPLSYSLREYGLFLGAAIFGGLVAWFNKVRAGLIPPWSVHHLVGELVTSAFAGLICFWLCEWGGANPLLTGVLTGISGHMGTRAISLFEQFAAKRFGSAEAPADAS